jgi:hypothetical protein
MYTIKVNDITYEVNVNDCDEIEACGHPVYITNNGKSINDRISRAVIS